MDGSCVLYVPNMQYITFRAMSPHANKIIKMNQPGTTAHPPLAPTYRYPQQYVHRSYYADHTCS